MIRKFILDYEWLESQPNWKQALLTRIGRADAPNLKDGLAKGQGSLVLVFVGAKPGPIMDCLEDLQQKYDTFYVVWGPEGQ